MRPNIDPITGVFISHNILNEHGMKWSLKNICDCLVCSCSESSINGVLEYVSEGIDDEGSESDDTNEGTERVVEDSEADIIMQDEETNRGVERSEASQGTSTVAPELKKEVSNQAS